MLSSTYQKGRKREVKKKAVISTSIAGISIIALCGFCYISNTYELKQDSFTVEYGSTLDTSPRAYVEANEAILNGTELDLSQVDTKRVGEYPATATYHNKTLGFEIKVEDTVIPEIQLTENIYGIAGKEISGVLTKATDAAGIKSITVKEGQVGDGVTQPEDLKMKYDTPGIYDNVLTVEDNNGNKTEQSFSVKIVEDYEKHVSGIMDLTVEQDNKIDWLADINKDEKIAEIQVDDSKVDMSKTGDYELKYTIVGDDKETKIEKKVKVTVVSESKAQELANDGKIVKTTDGNKQKYVPPTPSYSAYESGSSSGGYSGENDYSYSGDSYSGGYSGGSFSGESDGGASGSSSESSGGGSWLDSLTPGQSWDITITDEGTISGQYGGDDQSGNATAESGTFDLN